MKIFALAAYAATLALAAKHFRTGNLYISIKDEKAHNAFTKIPEYKIVADNQYTKFEYIMGTLMSPETGKYLSFNEVGWLVLDDNPHPGFFLKDISKTPLKSLVTFNDVASFQYCVDRSIGLKSQCRTIANEISIMFEDI